MSVPQYRIISLGTMAANPLWNERAPVRTGHATTTLIIAGDRRIIVDPGLPVPALEQRLSERTPIRARDITDVFLTSFTPDHLRGIDLFANARWLLAEAEHDAARARLASRTGTAEAGALESLAGILARCQPAPDSLAGSVDLFPLPGVTTGCCGILLPLPTRTVLIAGDAVASIDHLERASILPGCEDHERAMESLREAFEIADEIVTGRDGVSLMNRSGGH